MSFSGDWLGAAIGSGVGHLRLRQHLPLTARQRHHRKAAALAALALVTLAAADRASSQDMEPRAYSNAPVGLNVLVIGYGHSDGGLSTNPVFPMKDPQLTVKTPFLAYARAFEIAGKSAKIDFVLPAGSLSGSARSGGSLLTRDVSGLVDPTARVSVNLFGAPALALPEFASFRQDLIVGASLQVTAPFGQYDPTRLVNLGANRWVFRPEVGISKAIGRLRLETALAVNLYTINHDYYVGGQTLEQRPVYSTRANLVYQFDSGTWVALNGTFYVGGRTRLDGVLREDLVQASRIGATLSLLVDRNNAIKLNAGNGVTARTGNTEFTTFGIAWQHRWGGGL